MYVNKKQKNAVEHFIKGKEGEQIFKSQFPLSKHSTDDEDYNAHVDFFYKGLKIAVKNNYNAKYDTVVVESRSFCWRNAWIDDDVDIIAFIVSNGEIISVKREDLKKLLKSNDFRTYRRKQRNGYDFEITFVPVESLLPLQVDL